MYKQDIWKRWGKGGFTIVLTGLIVTGLAGCASTDKALTEPASTAQAKQTVKISKVVKQKVGHPIEQLANLSPSVQMDVVVKANGDVRSILKKRGDEVKAGDVILQLDTRDQWGAKQKARLALQGAEEELKKDQASLVNAKLDMQGLITKAQQQIDIQTQALNLLKNNYDDGLIEKKQLDQDQLQLDNALKELDAQKNKLAALNQTDTLVSQKIQVEAAKVGLTEANQALDYYEVKAPANGILTEMTAVVGATVLQSSKVGYIQTMNPLMIKTMLSEDYAAYVRGKDHLDFYLADKPNQKLNAKISYLSDILDIQSRTFPLELTLDNPDKSLKPGMKVLLQLTDESQQHVLTIPTNSIIREAGDTFVYIYAQGQVEKRKVAIGRLEDTIQEVLTGVKLDEQVVISGQNQLKDKQQVDLAK